MRTFGIARLERPTRGRKVKVGLLVKYDDTYNHTTFGKIIYHDYLLRLEKDISNSKHMEMIDVLNQSSKFSKDEIKEIFPNMR